MFQRLLESFRRFMYGRNGLDRLSYFVLIVAILFNLFFALTHNRFFVFIYWVLFFVFFWRVLSRNITARQRENEAFLSFTNLFRFKTGQKVSDYKSNKELKKQYHLFKCPHCGQKLRMPHGKGTVEVTCHNCHTTFQEKS